MHHLHISDVQYTLTELFSFGIPLDNHALSVSTGERALSLNYNGSALFGWINSY